MLFIFVFFILNFATYEIAQGEPQQQQKQQRLVKSAEHRVVGWRPEYTCYFHNPKYCVWSKDGQALDPSQHGYNYHSKDNCSIIGHSGRVKQISGISCAGYINCDNTIINSELNQSVDLNCQSTTLHTKCGWKRNNATVSIDGTRISYTSNRTKDCSIRIRNIQNSDFGKWTCTYLSKNAEIIALYSINNMISSIQDSNRKCEPQRIAEIPNYHTLGWSHTYTCPFHNPQQCLWLNREKQFDPTQYGYFYESPDKCRIKGNDYSLDKLHETHGDISCIGYLNYNTTSIDVGLGQNVDLHCQSTSRFTSCVWNRNEVVVSIGGKYSSYISNPTKDCSIRINNIKQIDIGQWTCSDQSTDNKNTEIIAVFTLSLNNRNPFNTKSEGKAYASTSGDPTSQTSLSTSVIALTVCTSVLILIIVGYIWKKKCKRTTAASQADTSQTESEVYDIPSANPMLVPAQRLYCDVFSRDQTLYPMPSVTEELRRNAAVEYADGYLRPIPKRAQNTAPGSATSSATNSSRTSDGVGPHYEEIQLLKH